MHKTILFVVVGTSLLLAGCKATDHRYQMIPVDGAPTPEIEPGSIPVSTPAPAVSSRRPQLPPPVSTPVVRNIQSQYTPMTGVVSSGGVDSAAGSKGTAVTAGGVKYHVVQRGEYPGLIAQKYKVRLAALMKANNLDEKGAKALRVGQKLIIPTGSSAQVSTGGKNTAPAPGGLVNGKHKVQRGETLDVIARRYKVKLSDLMNANNMTEASARRMRVGHLLIIPGKTSGTQASPASNNSSGKNTASNTRNTGSNAAPVDPLMMEQDTLILDADISAADLAAKYGISLVLFQEINGGLTDARLSKGSVVIVPKK